MSSSPRPAPTAGADGGDDDDRRDDRSGTDSEGEGDDLRPGVNDDDSSEEEEDDPEEVCNALSVLSPTPPTSLSCSLTRASSVGHLSWRWKGKRRPETGCYYSA